MPAEPRHPYGLPSRAPTPHQTVCQNTQPHEALESPKAAVCALSNEPGRRAPEQRVWGLCRDKTRFDNSVSLTCLKIRRASSWQGTQLPGNEL